jgi:UDP-N-acetylmuramyl tripeptide synthase
MQEIIGTLTGKTVKSALRFRRNGGHTLPGLIIESFLPKYLEKMLRQLPDGIVVITGTNGKTTTTKIVTEILKANGKKVLTNQTGSNLSRGIVSAISQHASLRGKLEQDIAVLEVDEAQARRLVSQITPRWVVALNVSRDQLDRFGEVDTTVSYIETAMKTATEGIITNSRDPKLFKTAQQVKNNNQLLRYFGASEKLAKFFPNDYELAAVDRSLKFHESHESFLKNDVELADFNGQKVIYKINDKKFDVDLKLSGQHNYLNGAAAMVLCQQLLPSVDSKKLLDDLSKVTLAFGRGEKYRLKGGAEIELVLVKNPASFTQALSSYASKDVNLMIAINDNIADGRDVSWLWDVDFEPLGRQKVCITSGTRAADMALRLSYDGIKTENIEPGLRYALNELSTQKNDKIILATYTAMLELYKMLSKQGEKV